ncbi:MAG: ABC transporter permease [Acidobacteria bacterium]|nr:MAG: ABC transporter permease [Acidobacteriota bacterium]REK12166.1 MAG: ABC transporter permease [Acidobacteriota bacterium]
MLSLLEDLRFGWRALRKRPVFALTAISALALGIGANTAIFSVLESLLLRPLPYEDPEQLVMVYLDNQMQGWPLDLTSYPNYEAWRDGAESLQDLAAFTRGSFSLTGDGDPERLQGASVGGSFFSLLGTLPLHGRWIGPAEDVPGADAVAVLSHDLFERRFGGDDSILGQQIQLDGQARTVIGVMPPRFEFPKGVKDFTPSVDLWVPMAPSEATRANRGGLWLWTVGRMTPGGKLDTLQAELGRVAANLAQEFPDFNRRFGVTVVGLHEHLVGGVRTGVWMLMGAVGFVLLVAIANVANLLLARAADREREIAVRAAMGASRGRVVRQMLTESVLLSLFGGLAGVAVGFAALRLLTQIAPSEIPLEGLRLSPVSLIFTVGVSLLAGLLFGAFPALAMSGARFGSALKEGGRGQQGGVRGRRMRSALVIAELALATVLLAGAGLMIRSLMRLDATDPGFGHRDALTFGLTLPRSSYGESEQVVGFYRDLVERLAALPGVDAATATTGVLLTEFPRSTTFRIEGRPEPTDEERIEVTIDAVMPGYFGTFGVPVLGGREFDGSERLDGPTQVVINQAFADRFFADQDPVGRRFTYGTEIAEDTDWMTIVGVVANTKRNGFEREQRIESYLPHEQFRSRRMTVLLRTDLGLDALAPGVRKAVWSLDADLPITDLEMLESRLAAERSDRRFYTLLLGAFSGVALALAMIGIYGVLSYLVAQTVPEIGVRVAFGASRLQVVGHVLRRGLMLAGSGILLGLLAALGLSGLLDSLLYGISGTDPLTYLALAGVLLAIALAACAAPARRATRIDPVTALRHE